MNQSSTLTELIFWMWRLFLVYILALSTLIFEILYKRSHLCFAHYNGPGSIMTSWFFICLLFYFIFFTLLKSDRKDIIIFLYSLVLLIPVFWSWPIFDFCQVRDQLKWESIFCFIGRRRLPSHVIRLLKLGYILYTHTPHTKVPVHEIFVLRVGSPSARHAPFPFWVPSSPFMYSLSWTFSSLRCTHKLPCFYWSLA